ncbi:MAG: hypothetical protein OES35_11020, partial [Chromatiales bacterium]|nr:hypothetical protein [Chromatiales bacterium]
ELLSGDVAARDFLADAHGDGKAIIARYVLVTSHTSGSLLVDFGNAYISVNSRLRQGKLQGW